MYAILRKRKSGGIPPLSEFRVVLHSGVATRVTCCHLSAYCHLRSFVRSVAVAAVRHARARIGLVYYHCVFPRDVTDQYFYREPFSSFLYL